MLNSTRKHMLYIIVLSVLKFLAYVAEAAFFFFQVVILSYCFWLR